MKQTQKKMSIAPTPAWTAWHYAAARSHPHWKVLIDERAGRVVPCGAAAGNINDVMAAYADTHTQEMARFAELPDDWDALTEAQYRLIAEGA